MTILVTGANGFVGHALCNSLFERGRDVLAAVRQNSPETDLTGTVIMPNLGTGADWWPLLVGVDVVVHAAARVHVMREDVPDPLSEFRKINTQGTLALANQAALAGVKRFVFLSTVKVMGECTPAGEPFCSDSIPAPSDFYSISKYEAELGLRALAEETDMEVVIVRPPLIYGPGVRANFRSMVRWLARGIPLPLGAIDNKRSLVALDNLIDLLITCIDHPAAKNQMLLVSDDDDLSTTELLRRLAYAMGKPARLIPVPVAVLEGAGALVGCRDVARRLCSSLQVDISRTRSTLDWSPVIDVDVALRKTVSDILSC